MDRCIHRTCNCQTKAVPASQTLEELDFLRSACSAAQKGDVQRLADLLVKRPASLVDDGVSGGHKHLSADGQPVVCAHLCLSCFLCAGQSGYTPLLYAARSGHLEAVTMLIKAGTDVLLTESCPI